MADTDVSFKFSADLEEVKKELQSLHDYMRQWGQSIKTIGTAAFAFTAAKSAIAGLTAAFQASKATLIGWLDAAEETEKRNIKLATAVKNAGATLGYQLKEIQAFATQLSGRSIFSTDEITSASSKLIGLGATGKEFRDIMLAAADAASLTGADIESMGFKIFTAMKNIDASGSGKGSTRLLRGILAREDVEQLKTGQELLELFQRRFKSGSEDMANSASGLRAQLRNLWSDIQANLGQGFLEGMKAFKDVLQAVYLRLRELSAAWAEWAKSVAESSGFKSTVEWLQDKFFTVAAAVEEFFSRLPEYFAMLKSLIADVVAAIMDAANMFNTGFMNKVNAVNFNARATIAARGQEQHERLAEKYMGEYERRKMDDEQRNKWGSERYEKEVLAPLKEAFEKESALAMRYGKDRVELRKEQAKQLDQVDNESYKRKAESAKDDYEKEKGRNKKSFSEGIDARKQHLKDLFAAPKLDALDHPSSTRRGYSGLLIDMLTGGLSASGKTSTDAFGVTSAAPGSLTDMMGRGRDALTNAWGTAVGLAREANIKAGLEDMAKGVKPKGEFKASIEDAQSMFRRMQTAAASREADPQTKLQEEMLQNIKQKMQSDAAEEVNRKKAWDRLANGNFIAMAGA